MWRKERRPCRKQAGLRHCITYHSLPSPHDRTARFAEWVRAYTGELLRYALARVKDDAEAEDLKPLQGLPKEYLKEATLHCAHPPASMIHSSP